MALSPAGPVGPSVIPPMVLAHRQQIKGKIADVQSSIEEAKHKSVRIAALVTRPPRVSVGEQCGRTLNLIG